MQSYAAANEAWKKVQEVIQVNEDFNVVLVQFLEWLKIAVKLSTEFITDKYVSLFLGWFLFFVVLVLFDQKIVGFTDPIANRLVDFFESLGIAPGTATTTMPTTTGGPTTTMPTTTGGPTDAAMQNVNFTKLTNALSNLSNPGGDLRTIPGL